jgi:hypothetical protein
VSAVDSQLEQALATLSNRTASSAELGAGAELARSVVVAIDAESERSPQRESEIMAGMASVGIQPTLKALVELDKGGEHRALTRKVAVALAAALDARAIEMAAAERARDPAVQREAQLQALFAKIPTLFRTDAVVSQLGKSAWSRTPRPKGSHVSYAQDYSVPRVLATQNVMTSTRLPNHWPPKYSDFAVIEWPNSVYDEDEAIAGPLRLLSEKSSPSEDEVQIAIERAQNVLLNEFARVCAEIRGYYQGELPRFVSLPAFTAPRAMAAE